MTIVALLIAGVLIVFALTAILNTFTFPRLNPSDQPINQPTVSILIPARNEAAVIGRTINLIMQQDYPNIEIIMLDDGSTDGTAQIAKDAAQTIPLQVIEGQPLPEGWMGKNFACHQLSQVASGDILIFTDADVQWQSDALSALVTMQQKQKADMLTVWPTQLTSTWSERLVVPLMSMAIVAYLPEFMVRFSPLVAFAAANGQCLMFQREAYEAIGGHAAVRDNITEDVGMARNTKKHGFKLVMADGNGQILCRMYDSWAAVRDGFGKNILAGHGNSVPFLLFSTLFHWVVFLLPWVWVFVVLLSGVSIIIPGILIITGTSVRALTAATTNQRLIDALLMPVSVLLMTRIAFQALWWQYRFGGPQWKGRLVVAQK